MPETKADRNTVMKDIDASGEEGRDRSQSIGTKLTPRVRSVRSWLQASDEKAPSEWARDVLLRGSSC